MLFASVMVAGLIIGVCARNTSTTTDGGDVAVVTQTSTPAIPSVVPSPSVTPPGGITGTPSGSVTPGPSETPPASPTAPPLTIDPAKTYFATIHTAKGDIRLQLDAAKAPQTVNNFVALARQGFYDNTTFHRVIPGFVAQGGDPTGTGGGGPGYTIPDEQSGLVHDAGVIAMAKEYDPQSQTPVKDSAGSQFYITLTPQHSLDGQFTVFGHVVSGMEVLQALTPRDPSQGGTLPPGDAITGITIEEQ